MECHILVFRGKPGVGYWLILEYSKRFLAFWARRLHEEAL
jgi:hypothetical protein